MKMIKKGFVLLLALTTMLLMSQAAFAQSSKVDGGTFTYDGGDSITSTAASGKIDKALAGLEPGDDVTFTFVYKNKTDNTTDWYMTNEVLQTLEESVEAAENGGYTYRLTNIGPDGKRTNIFKSDAVGGDKGEGPDGIEEGLKAATDATTEWFFIQELKAKQSGKTELYVALDGESQVNTYMTTAGELQLNYAVEEQGKVVVPPPPGPKTGDNFNLLPALAALTAALLALILTILSWRKDRKGGEVA